MSRLLIAAALLLAATSAWGQGSYFNPGPPGISGSSAYPGSAVPLRDRGRFHGYVGARPHRCTWSISTGCSRWRARGGKFICPPGNMSRSCQLQRAAIR